MKGIIYSINYKDDLYVGSTIYTLGTRRAKHRWACYAKDEKSYYYPIYQKMRKYKFGSWKFEVIETIDVENITELAEIEYEWIKILEPSMNTNKGLSVHDHKEYMRLWRLKNKVKLQAQRKAYREKYPERIKAYRETALQKKRLLKNKKLNG